MEEMHIKGTLEEGSPPSHVQRLVHRLKEAVHVQSAREAPQHIPAQESQVHALPSSTSHHTSSFHSPEDTKATAQDTVKLREIVRVLADRLKEAQATITTLRSQTNTLSESQDSVAASKLSEAEKFFEERQLEANRKHEHELHQIQAELSATASKYEKALLEKEARIHALEEEKLRKDESLKAVQIQLIAAQEKAKSNASSSTVDLEPLHAEIARLRQEVKDKNSELIRIKSAQERSIQSTQKSGMSKPDAPQQESVARLALSMKALEDEVHSFRCERVALQREMKRLSDELRRESAKASELREANKTLSSQLEQLNQEVPRLNNQLEEEKSLRVDLERSLSQRDILLCEVQEQKAQLQKIYDELQEEHVSLQSSYSAAQSHNEALISEISQLKNMCDSKDKECSSLNIRLEEVEQLLTEKIQKTISLEEELEGLQQQHENALLERSAAQEAQRQLEESIAAITEEHSSLKEHHENLEKELSSVQEAHQALRHTIERLEAVRTSSIQAHDLVKKGLEIMQKAQQKYAIEIGKPHGTDMAFDYDQEPKDPMAPHAHQHARREQSLIMPHNPSSSIFEMGRMDQEAEKSVEPPRSTLYNLF